MGGKFLPLFLIFDASIGPTSSNGKVPSVKSPMEAPANQIMHSDPEAKIERYSLSNTPVKFPEAFWSLFLLFVICPSISYIVWKLISKLRSKVPSKTSDKQRKFRFRNRDKVRYHAIRLSRKFGAMTARLNELTSREEKQKVIIDFVKTVFNRKPDGRDPILLQRNLPESFFQPEPDDETCNMPEDLKLMVCRVRMLNYLGRRVTVGLAGFIKTVELDTGQYLFNTGDLENNIFVVKTGQVDLILMDPDGNEVVVHEVTAGGNPYTLMAIIDWMIKQPSNYQSAKAIAATSSTVICLSIPDLLKVCQQNPPAMLRLVQMICVCIQRVTFSALHNFFGLDKELFNQTPPAGLPDSSVTTLIAGREDAASLTEAFPSAAKQTCTVLKRGSDALTSTARQLARGSLTPLNLYGATAAAGAASNVVELNSDIDAETASLDEVSAPIGLDTASGRVIPGSQPADLLELGEVLPPATTPSSSVPREGMTENCGVSGTERRLVITRSFRKTHSRLSSDVSAIHGSDVEMDDDSALDAEGDVAMGETDLAETENEVKDPLLLAAEEDLSRLLGLPDANLMRGLVSIVSVNRGDVLSKELELQAELYYVLSGELQVLQTTTAKGHDMSPPKAVTCLVCRQGEIVGLLGVITGEPNNGSIHATCPTLLAVLPREQFFLLIRGCPDVLINAAALVTRRLSPLCRLSDFALEWHSVDAGKALYKQGDPSSYMYVVLNGRFREVHAYPDGSKQVICEVGRGAFIGFVEVSGAKPRVSTVMALRDSEVVQIPSILLHWLRRLTPHPVNRFIQILSDRLIGSLQRSSSSSPSSEFTVTAAPFQSPLSYMLSSQPVVNIAGSGPFNSSSQQQQPPTDASLDSARIAGGAMANLRAIAIIPSSSKINAEAFCLELQHAISVFGSSIRLTSKIINRRVGSNALEPVNEYRLSSWLNHQEDLHRMIFYVGDSQQGNTAWTRRCLRQADCVMVLALATDDPTRPSAIEEIVSKDSSKVTKLLVLMHTLETDYPPVKSTAAWLNARPWVNQHYHIRCPPRVLSKRSSRNLVVFYSRVFSCETPNPHADISRLARYLTGQAVGLVLGGGGAKGGAHVGVIRAFQEAGIPIDMIGGTSIGAFVGALWAEETRVAQCSQRARDFALVFKSVWPKIRDLTYPTVSLFSGYEFNVHIETIFKDRQIEDLWIPYFCITTDISNCKMRIHTNGSLWRYIRASMSYPSLLPPLCDPIDSHLLLDGAFVNNLPGIICEVSEV
uniref:Patatin-like phospholipase domain-containing protein 7 n=1 Tax=Schistocephalus solidus TaxID=70667 RepID=A0A0X3NX62_SCHSO